MNNDEGAESRPTPSVQAIFAFLSRRYVQRSDARQRDMGLQYMVAETHDLAETLAKWLDTCPGCQRLEVEPAENSRSDDDSGELAGTV